MAARTRSSANTLAGVVGSIYVLIQISACEAPGDTYAFVDRAEVLPAGTPAGDDVLDRSKQKLPEVDHSKCGRSSGRLPDGTCISLRVRDTPRIQQVQIPTGTFVMGRIPDDYNSLPAHDQPAVRWSGQPPRPVAVESFWLDLYEVTRGDYAACVEKGACTPISCPEGIADPVASQPPDVAALFPQTCVTHAQAEAFCAAQGQRLPTEAEWEYAARGVDVRRFAWGDEVEDRIPEGLYPAGRVRLDQSYFNILGMGSNALEWVADRYDPEAALRPFLKGDFRQPGGPLAASRAAFERRVHCGDAPAPGCKVPAQPERHVIKSIIVGARRAVRSERPEHLQQAELEGWPTTRVIDQLGFRCAADVEPDPENPVLAVPKASPMVPLVRTAGELQVFGGVAEAVSHSEAQAFCRLLQVPLSGHVLGSWRLPDAAEIEGLQDVFRGPGPFWVRDGAVTQHVEGESSVEEEAPWRQVTYEPSEALAARCVRATAEPPEEVEVAPDESSRTPANGADKRVPGASTPSGEAGPASTGD